MQHSCVPCQMKLARVFFTSLWGLKCGDYRVKSASTLCPYACEVETCPEFEMAKEKTLPSSFGHWLPEKFSHCCCFSVLDLSQKHTAKVFRSTEKARQLLNNKWLKKLFLLSQTITNMTLLLYQQINRILFFLAFATKRTKPEFAWLSKLL